MAFYALLSLPSPPSPVVFEAGSLTLHYYGLFIALGTMVGAWLTSRELARRGYGGALVLLLRRVRLAKRRPNPVDA